jgi:hypothetical protein
MIISFGSLNLIDKSISDLFPLKVSLMISSTLKLETLSFFISFISPFIVSNPTFLKRVSLEFDVRFS